MVSGCSGIINDRVYAVTPSNNSYIVDSTLLNSTSSTIDSGCPPVSPFTYSACTIINDPPTIVLVGTDAHGVAGTRLLQFSSTGSCQKSDKWYSITGMTQAVSVVPATCDSQTSIPCFAVLGISSTTRQYIIQYPTSLSFNTSNPISVGLGDSTIHPVLALPPNDSSKLYVIGYPSSDQILVLLNGNTQTNGQSSIMPTVFSTSTNTLYGPTTTDTTHQSLDKNNGIIPRAVATYGPDIGNNGAGSYIKLETAIENTGPAATVGSNIVIVSSNSLSVEIIPASISSSVLHITKLDMLPSSQVQNANSLKGIDSLTPLPAQNGDLSTIWINYDDGNGNHVQTSSQQPGLFTSPTGSDTPGSESTYSADNSSAPSLSTGAIVGIAIGSVVGCILLVLVCFYLWRRQRQNKRHGQRVNDNNRSISLTDQRFLTEKTASTPTTYVSTPNKDDSVSAITPTTDHAHHDDSIDDAPPLSSLTRQINNLSIMHDDTYYEPTSTSESLLLESFVYSLHNEPPSYASFPQGYATRTATRTHNVQYPHRQQPIECTIHYFPEASATWFRHLLHTNTGLQDHHHHAVATGTLDDQEKETMPAGLHTYDAITLAQPTKHGHYQYIWITSPFHQHHTLYSLLFEGGGRSSVVDSTQFSFKAWSTLSMLKSLDYFHQCGWVHRKLNASCFFYDQASSVTDWRLAGFYQSVWYTGLADKPMMGFQLDECSAPECMMEAYAGRNQQPMMKMVVSLPSMDTWSLGCVLYSVATGKRAFQHMNEYQALLQSGQLQAKLDAMVNEAALVDESYRELLRRMLQINPGARDSLPNIINYWIQANQLDDDE